ncbi:MAG: DJ-1/PfpI family protein [Actinomycetota bacterium]
MSDEIRQIGIFLFPDVEELDAVGPWEVLSYWARNFPEDGFAVSTFSLDGEMVVCAKGLRITPDWSFGSMPRLHVLLYPGGQGTRPHLKNPEQLEWVRAQRKTVPLMTSVCTGSLVFAAAGLLANRPATTHWASLDLLQSLDPTIDVRREDERFVDDGDVITSAGVSAGIDMALHLVDRLAGTERARQVRRGIQYDPLPPI